MGTRLLCSLRTAHPLWGPPNLISYGYKDSFVKVKRLGREAHHSTSSSAEVKRRLSSDNACYHSFQNLLSSRLLSKNLKIRIYKTIVLPVFLYGCETLSLTLREEHRPRVFENRALRRIFGPRRVEVTGQWRKLHNEGLRNLYSLPNVIRIIKSRRMRWAGHAARTGKKRNAYRLMWGSLRERDH
jgi:hypothetical protein